MKTHTVSSTLIAGLLCFAAVNVSGEDVVRNIDWKQAASDGSLAAEHRFAQGPDGRTDALEIVNTSDGPKTVTLLSLEEPGISEFAWSFRGQLRYEIEGGKGYLEMWSSFADGSKFFSRTMAEHGPMQALSGTSGWRPFVLPFQSSPETGSPQKLEINMVFPGPGKVLIGPLEVVQFTDRENPLTPSEETAWWSPRQAGVVGAVFGLFAGLLGTLAGVLVGTGSARGLALGILRFMAIIGIIAFAVGAFAALRQQPYAVWYPPTILGVILTGVGLTVTPFAKRAYAAQEERRMQAMDQ